MSSIQRRLIVWLTVACVTLLVATGAVIYRFFRADVVGQFDRALETEAQVLSSCVTYDREGHLDFDYSTPPSSQRQLLGGPEYFVIRYADGRVFREHGSSESALQLSDDSTVRDVRLRSGKMHR